jgi:hypothetical protein
MAEAGVDIELATEMPDWMIDEIHATLRDTYSREYWHDITKTTGHDIERYLDQGLTEGWSIRRISKEMAVSFQGGTAGYGFRRSKRIAVTEAGYALNSARSASINALKEEIPQLQIRRSWRAQLSNTTRDTHADLDGVPEDTDGGWFLGGVHVSVPGHPDLPVGERVTCYCTVSTEFGMGDEEARELIANHEERRLAREAEGYEEVERVEAEAEEGDSTEEKVGLDRYNVDLDASKVGTDVSEEVEALLDRELENLNQHKAFADLAENRGYEIDLQTGRTFRDRNGNEVSGLYQTIEKKIQLASGVPQDPAAVPAIGEWLVGTDAGSMFRHEASHKLYYEGMIGSERRVWKHIATPYVGKKEGKEQVSGYGATSPTELFAESMAAYTSPNYERGSLPRVIEMTVEKVLRGDDISA